jgi:hypothetical protein
LFLHFHQCIFILSCPWAPCLDIFQTPNVASHTAFTD